MSVFRQYLIPFSSQLLQLVLISYLIANAINHSILSLIKIGIIGIWIQRCLLNVSGPWVDRVIGPCKGILSHKAPGVCNDVVMLVVPVSLDQIVFQFYRFVLKLQILYVFVQVFHRFFIFLIVSLNLSLFQIFIQSIRRVHCRKRLEIMLSRHLALITLVPIFTVFYRPERLSLPPLLNFDGSNQLIERIVQLVCQFPGPLILLIYSGLVLLLLLINSPEALIVDQLGLPGNLLTNLLLIAHDIVMNFLLI